MRGVLWVLLTANRAVSTELLFNTESSDSHPYVHGQPECPRLGLFTLVLVSTRELCTHAHRHVCADTPWLAGLVWALFLPCRLHILKEQVVNQEGTGFCSEFWVALARSHHVGFCF